MMAAVAVGAVALATERQARRWAEYRDRAEHHGRALQTLAFIRQHGVYPYCSLGIEDIPLRFDPGTSSLHTKSVFYHTRLKEKYRWAMWHPWLSIAPDPPPP
jgi:hypothetical protein